MGFCRHLAEQNGEQMGTAKLAIEMSRDLGRIRRRRRAHGELCADA